MAETIDYKVQIDTSDLSNQLQNIKNQVDQAMATYAFRSIAPDPQPSMYSFPSLGNVGMSVGQAIDTGGQTALTSARAALETGRLGFHKLMQDVQNLALATPIGMPPKLFDYREKIMPSFSENPWGSAMSALTGWGYDTRSSLSFGDYNRFARNEFSDHAIKNLNNIMSTTAGGIIGQSYGGLIGAFVGEKVLGTISDIGYGAWAGTVGRDYETAANIRSMIRDSSWRFMSGKIGSMDASSIALGATQLGRRDDMMGRGMYSEDIQQIIKGYTEAGGFDLTRSASELKDALKIITTSVRESSQTLQMAAPEYLSFHAKMSQLGMITSTTGALSLSKTIAAEALGAGYSPQELVSFGQQTMETLRGTGIMLGPGFLSGASTLSSVSNMVQSGAISNEQLLQLGGRENIAATVNRLGYNWGMSNAGFTYMAAQLGNQNFNMVQAGPLGSLQAAISSVGGDIGRYLGMKGSTTDFLSSLTGAQLMTLNSAQAVDQAATILNYGGQNLTKQTFRAYEQTQGVDVTQADLMWSYAFGTDASLTKLSTNLTNQAVLSLPPITQIIKDKVNRGFADIFQTDKFAVAGIMADRWTNKAVLDLENLWDKSVRGYSTELTGKQNADYSKIFYTAMKNGVPAVEDFVTVNLAGDIAAKKYGLSNQFGDYFGADIETFAAINKLQNANLLTKGNTLTVREAVGLNGFLEDVATGDYIKYSKAALIKSGVAENVISSFGQVTVATAAGKLEELKKDAKNNLPSDITPAQIMWAANHSRFNGISEITSIHSNLDASKKSINALKDFGITQDQLLKIAAGDTKDVLTSLQKIVDTPLQTMIPSFALNGTIRTFENKANAAQAIEQITSRGADISADAAQDASRLIANSIISARPEARRYIAETLGLDKSALEGNSSAQIANTIMKSLSGITSEYQMNSAAQALGGVIKGIDATTLKTYIGSQADMARNKALYSDSAGLIAGQDEMVETLRASLRTKHGVSSDTMLMSGGEKATFETTLQVAADIRRMLDFMTVPQRGIFVRTLNAH